MDTSGPTTSSDVPSLYLTLRVRPSGAATTSETAALVIIVLGLSIGRWPSPSPRRASGRMRSSVECSFPSACLTAAEAMKSPALIALRLDGSLAMIIVPDDKVKEAWLPSFALTTSIWASLFSTVPCMRTVASWAAAGRAESVNRPARRAPRTNIILNSDCIWPPFTQCAGPMGSLHRLGLPARVQVTSGASQKHRRDSWRP